jgi:hypothetical protein
VAHVTDRRHHASLTRLKINRTLRYDNTSRCCCCCHNNCPPLYLGHVHAALWHMQRSCPCQTCWWQGRTVSQGNCFQRIDPFGQALHRCCAQQLLPAAHSSSTVAAARVVAAGGGEQRRQQRRRCRPRPQMAVMMMAVMGSRRRPVALVGAAAARSAH